MKQKFKIFSFCLLSVAFIGCDRFTKNLAKDHLRDKEVISYLHDTVRLEYVENTGAALNLGDNLSRPLSFWLLSILPLVCLLLLAVYAIRNSEKMRLPKLLFISAIVAGGIGNIIDRLLFDRHVTDFMNIGISHFRTGIFNVADVCVTIGAIGLVMFNWNTTEKKPHILQNL
ncbi:MAG: signal peptidase II [Chitinophagaceae bacterium]|nr:signal peptidase II [Chitinophagaceae bacterium]